MGSLGSRAVAPLLYSPERPVVAALRRRTKPGLRRRTRPNQHRLKGVPRLKGTGAIKAALAEVAKTSAYKVQDNLVSRIGEMSKVWQTGHKQSPSNGPTYSDGSESQAESWYHQPQILKNSFRPEMVPQAPPSRFHYPAEVQSPSQSNAALTMSSGENERLGGPNGGHGDYLSKWHQLFHKHQTGPKEIKYNYPTADSKISKPKMKFPTTSAPLTTPVNEYSTFSDFRPSQLIETKYPKGDSISHIKTYDKNCNL